MKMQECNLIVGSTATNIKDFDGEVTIKDAVNVIIANNALNSVRNGNANSAIRKALNDFVSALKEISEVKYNDHTYSE